VLLRTVFVSSFAVAPADSSHLLAVLVSADLFLQQHVSVVAACCFCQLRQI